jgi:LemA protein
MGVVITILVVVAILMVFYLIALYNSCVQKRNVTKESWSNIDVLLKQRHDELPKLVTACKQYMQHESGTLEKVIAARNRVHEAVSTNNVQALGLAEMLLRQSVGNLFAVAEKYPNLQADKLFTRMQKRITELETEIADKRESYNDNVNLFNTKIEQFPARVFVGKLGFKVFELLSFGDEEKSDVDMDGQFSS